MQGFEISMLESLLWNQKSKPSVSERFKVEIPSSLGEFWGIDGLGSIVKDQSYCDLAIETSSSCLGTGSFTFSGI